MKFYLILLFTLVSNYLIYAQHCAYDFAHIFVLKVSSEKSTKCIRGLKISVLDSNGIKLKNERWSDKENDFIEFDQILKENSKNHPSPRGFHNEDYNDDHYYFAQDNYIYIRSLPRESLYLLIEDIDGFENQGYFKSLKVEVNPSNFYPLCSEYSSWFSGEQFGFVKDFKELEVHLDLKDSLSFDFLKGNYLIYKENGSIHTLPYQKIKLFKNGKFKLIDETLSTNDLDIPNTHKAFGTYRIDGTSLILTLTKTVYFYPRINAPRWFRKLYDKKKKVNKDLEDTIELKIKFIDQQFFLSDRFNTCLYLKQ